MKNALIYIHGKGGNADEAEHYKPLFADCDVIGLDYRGDTPWDTKEEFLNAYHKLRTQYEHISILANSIGAYFAMNALPDADIKRAFFISPMVDMEKLITDMMMWANVSETELAEKKEIATSFGETLSWEYLCYVRQNPLVWRVPTDILYGAQDNLTSLDTITAFAEQHYATLTVMKNGEHWFHTDEQISFVDNWLKHCIAEEK